MKRYCLFEDDYLKKKLCNGTCEHFDTCSRKNHRENYEPSLLEMEKELKARNVHAAGELKIMQSYSLDRKIQLTAQRISDWHQYWNGKVFIAISGGKDSQVLDHIAKHVCGLEEVPVCFVNTGLEYDSVRNKAMQIADEVLQPKKSFVQVITEYGYPIASKEVSQAIYECQVARRLGKPMPKYRVDKLQGKYIDPKTGKKSSFNMERWGFLLDAPFRISHMCCKVMKKAPSIDYERQTGRKPIMAIMADESRLRRSRWLRDGCNAFYNDRPTSMPMSFWTEQDVLMYIKKNGLDIADVYGDVVYDYSSTDDIEGQSYVTDFLDMPKDEQHALGVQVPKLRLTGEPRTGCVFCLFSIGQDKTKLLRLKHNDPKKYDYVMRGGKFDEHGMWIPSGGLGYEFVVDWLNEHGDLGIEY